MSNVERGAASISSLPQRQARREGERGRRRSAAIPPGETALGPKAALLDFEKGMPDTGYLVGSGFPSVPRSVLQSLAHLGMWFPFMRLERILPEPLIP